MKNILFRLALTSAVLFSSSLAVAEPAKPESIKELMQLTGSGELSIQMMNQMLPALKELIPNAPETFWQDIMAKIDSDAMEDLVIPVYQKYLSEEDVKALNTFYDSPVGQKMIRVQPAIMQETMLLGQQWGQSIARDVLQQYQQQVQ